MRNNLGIICVLAVGLAGGLVGACGQGAQVVSRQVRDFIQNVQTGDGQARGALVQGSAPDSSGGPTPTSNVGSATVLTGGTTPVTINSDVAFGTIIVLVGGAEDYYEINLPAPTGSAEILLTFGEDVPQDEFSAVFTVVDTQGHVGQYISTDVNVSHVESGDVQVTVTWDAPSDVDLAVIGPDEERISFQNRNGDNGASLTVDSNANCQIDNIDNESITYPTGMAPSGTYTVEVRLFDGCGTLSTNFTVTVLRDGAEEPIIERETFSSVATNPGGTTGSGGVPPTTGQIDSGLFTFTFEFPPRGVDQECPQGQTFDTELGECVPIGTDCGGSVTGESFGLSCEIAGETCPDGTTICSSDLLCTVGCDLTCGNQQCGGALPVCALDSALDQAVCTTGGGVEEAGEYEACGTTGEPAACAAPSRCLGLTGLEAVAKPMCAPPCADAACPALEGVAGVCGLGEDGSQTPTRCVLVCDPNDPTCPTGMTCQAVQSSGICIWPLSAAPSP